MRNPFLVFGIHFISNELDIDRVVSILWCILIQLRLFRLLYIEVSFGKVNLIHFQPKSKINLHDTFSNKIIFFEKQLLGRNKIKLNEQSFCKRCFYKCVFFADRWTKMLTSIYFPSQGIHPNQLLNVTCVYSCQMSILVFEVQINSIAVKSCCAVKAA